MILTLQANAIHPCCSLVRSHRLEAKRQELPDGFFPRSKVLWHFALVSRYLPCSFQECLEFIFGSLLPSLVLLMMVIHDSLVGNELRFQCNLRERLSDLPRL